jgi:hypothetical protein
LEACKEIKRRIIKTAQHAVGTDLAFGQGSRRLESSLAFVVY